jgi:hypothetical protein
MPAKEQLSTEQVRGAKSRRATGAVLLIVLPFLILAVAYIRILFRMVFLRDDVTYPEGVGIYGALTALRTGHLYSDPFQFPWNYQMYGPVYYVFGYVFAKLTHGDPTLTTELMRSLSLASFLGSAGLIGYLSWRLERRGIWVVTSIILSLACRWAVPYGASARSDSLAIFFILSALTVYQVAEGRTRLVFWAGVLGALGFLTKQTVAPVLLALALDSLFARRFRNIAALIGGSVVVTIPVLLVLWLRHEPFIANFTIMRGEIVIWSTAIRTAFDFVRVNQISVIGLGIALLGVGRIWKEERYRPILIVAAFCCVENVAALANTGGDVNYFILPWLLIVLFVPAGLIRIEEWAQRSILCPVALALLGGVILFHQSFLLRLLPGQDLEAKNVGSLRLLSDSPYLGIRSSNPAFLDPFFYHQLSLHGLWSVAPIVASVDKKEYDLILLSGDDHPQNELVYSVKSFRGFSNWDPAVLEAIRQNYRVLCEVPGFMALAPQDRSSTLRDADISEIFQQPCVTSSRSPQLGPDTR